MSAAVSQEKFFYGGQAVLEGVMMRGRTTYAVAVRRPDGEIEILRERLRSIIYTHPVWKLPLLRGLAGLWEQLHLGMKALMWSANIQAAAEQVELSATAIRITMGIAVVGALLFFLGVPLLAAGFLSRGHGNLFFGVVDGVVRIALPRLATRPGAGDAGNIGHLEFGWLIEWGTRESHHPSDLLSRRHGRLPLRQ